MNISKRKRKDVKKEVFRMKKALSLLLCILCLAAFAAPAMASGLEPIGSYQLGEEGGRLRAQPTRDSESLMRIHQYLTVPVYGTAEGDGHLWYFTYHMGKYGYVSDGIGTLTVYDESALPAGPEQPDGVIGFFQLGKDGARLRERPTQESETIDRVHQYETVPVYSEAYGDGFLWYQVWYNGLMGYVSAGLGTYIQ